MHLRAATVDDVPLILEFIRGLAEYEKLTDEVEATEEKLRTSLFPSREGAAGPLRRPAAECVLAFTEEEPAGFALFFQTYSTFLARPGIWLEDLFVKPHLRGRGIGRELLLHVAALASERGCGRMEWSVLDWNAPALAFYQSLGARPLPDWRICRLTGESLHRHRRG
jgi:GNAT superfamily N-acetyltransferase